MKDLIDLFLRVASILAILVICVTTSILAVALSSVPSKADTPLPKTALICVDGKLASVPASVCGQVIMRWDI